jgi:hypothetical protein
MNLFYLDQPAGSRYTLAELREMVANDPRTKTLSREEAAAYIEALNEHRDQKGLSVRANNLAAARDVVATTDRIVKEVCLILNCKQLNSTFLLSWMICEFGPASMAHYLLSAVTLTTPFKAQCTARIILKISGMMCTSIPWLTFLGNTNNGHAPRIKVSPSYLYSLCTYATSRRSQCS